MRITLKNNVFCLQVPPPMVDDDLLEFLVRVADNPAEWNKIQRVLSKYNLIKYNYKQCILREILL